MFTNSNHQHTNGPMDQWTSATPKKKTPRPHCPDWSLLHPPWGVKESWNLSKWVLLNGTWHAPGVMGTKIRKGILGHYKFLIPACILLYNSRQNQAACVSYFWSESRMFTNLHKSKRLNVVTSPNVAIIHPCAKLMVGDRNAKFETIPALYLMYCVQIHI